MQLSKPVSKLLSSACQGPLKPAVKGNESKKLKSKSGMKRKIKNSSDSLSSSVDEKELRRLLKKLKYVKQEDSDESVSDRKMKYKKNEKELTPTEVAHEEYLRFSNLCARRVAGLKGEICLDVVRRLREDSNISKIDWCGYIHAIRAWNSTLMRQREKLELNAHVLGILELHDESTGGGYMLTTEKEFSLNLIKKAEEKLSIVCSERVFLEGCLMTASEKYPGDRKFFEIHQKYAEVFKNPIEFGYHESILGDDVNGDHDTGNGDDVTRNGDDDTGNGDDDVGVDDVANEDDYDNDDNGGSKKQVESTEKQSVDPTDPTGKENVFEEENGITCTPESYTQWLDANADFFLEKKLFARHLRLYGHERHSKIGRLKARIPKLKWKTKANFRDCGIFTMLHMESYMGQTAKRWDCGLVAESKQQCDMLRLLRFKFATKILLHEINVHAQKMIRYAEEFDKIAGFEKMCKVVDALKNRKEREQN
ncbi:hypothetical protein Tco_0773185 [Tanacetum coccineum]|uniref:Ulp1 protease family, C-terminal catalytic domain-containing protein n=1 Tax=Tanacetum coccineum TaxID=301880 RepID=A0ABQ4ZK11_9ASTR